MEIIFKGPTFFAQEDENHFFEWIYALPSYLNITGKGLDLHLELKEPVDKETVEQLLIIFRRWNVDVASLKSLRSEKNKGFILWEVDLTEAAQ